MRRLVVGILGCLVASTDGGTALAQQPPRSSCLRIEYEVATQCVRDKDGSGPQPATEERSQAKVVVTLGARAVAWQSEGTLSSWDFEAGVGRTIDRAAGTYSEVSLLHEAGFVQAEMRNRQRLQEVLSAGKVELGAWEAFDLSVLFCWPAKGDDVRLERAEEGGEVRFRRGEDVVTSWRPSEHALDEAQRGVFARLLQRRAHLHPQVLEALAASGRLPAELVFRWREPGSMTTATWRLTGVATADEWPGSVDKLQRSFGDGPLARIARMVFRPDAEGVPDRVSTERFAELAEAARKNGRFADAAMLLLESGLSTGAEVSKQMRGLVADAAAKEQVMAFMRPVTLANSEPEKALELFGALDRSQLSRPAFLDVFRVTALSRQGKVQDALDLMLATLETSPWIAMAYKDLGDLYYASFDTAQAWTAWELGRRVAPAHGCWKEIATHEGLLRREFAGRL